MPCTIAQAAHARSNESPARTSPVERAVARLAPAPRLGLSNGAEHHFEIGRIFARESYVRHTERPHAECEVLSCREASLFERLRKPLEASFLNGFEERRTIPKMPIGGHPRDARSLA
jgi:hypothetical protein